MPTQPNPTQPAHTLPVQPLKILLLHPSIMFPLARMCSVHPEPPFLRPGTHTGPPVHCPHCLPRDCPPIFVCDPPARADPTAAPPPASVSGWPGSRPFARRMVPDPDGVTSTPRIPAGPGLHPNARTPPHLPSFLPHAPSVSQGHGRGRPRGPPQGVADAPCRRPGHRRGPLGPRGPPPTLLFGDLPQSQNQSRRPEKRWK